MFAYVAHVCLSYIYIINLEILTNEPIKSLGVSFGIIVQEPMHVMLGNISDFNTAILPINEMFLWFQFFIIQPTPV
jgi:hypothetical protein